MRIYWTNNLDPGNMALMARPRGNDWLKGEIHSLSKLGIDVLVSLLEDKEVSELELQQESSLCDEAGIKFISFPIRDRSVPADTHGFRVLIDQLFSEISNGKKIAVHCRMGIGRTGLVAGGVLARKGYSVHEAFDLLSKIRTMRMPDTQEQIDWLKNCNQRH